MPMLSGIKVVELTNMITAPLCGMMLADLGAEVIKVENPKGGDLFRNWRGGTYSLTSRGSHITGIIHSAIGQVIDFTCSARSPSS